jgi:predicted DNA-binding transcriptional regulator YafY
MPAHIRLIGKTIGWRPNSPTLIKDSGPIWRPNSRTSGARSRERNHTVPTPTWELATVDPQQLTALAAAITNHERVRFTYRAADGASSQRLVEPHRLVAADYRWYLLAYDNDRHDWRTFRVGRLGRTQSTGVRVPPRPLPATDAATYLTDKLYDLAPTYRAVVTLHTPAGQAAARLGDTADTLQPIDEHTCRWHSHADNLDWLAFRLTLLGCDFTVHEPTQLIDHLRTLGTRITRSVTASPHPGLPSTPTSPRRTDHRV